MTLLGEGWGGRTTLTFVVFMAKFDCHDALAVFGVNLHEPLPSVPEALALDGTYRCS